MNSLTFLWIVPLSVWGWSSGNHLFFKKCSHSFKAEDAVVSDSHWTVWFSLVTCSASYPPWSSCFEGLHSLGLTFHSSTMEKCLLQVQVLPGRPQCPETESGLLGEFLPFTPGVLHWLWPIREAAPHSDNNPMETSCTERGCGGQQALRSSVVNSNTSFLFVLVG